MAQLIVRNLEDKVRDRLRARAEANGRSMEAEVREILRAAVLRSEAAAQRGLGSQMAARFGAHGLDAEIPELRDQPQAIEWDE